MKKTLLALAAAAALTAMATTAFAGRTINYTYKVMSWNDLGMHCACPTFEGFLLLPPFNTVRTQVFAYGPNDPVVVDSAFAATNGLTVSYAIPENTDAILKADPYFASWIANAPKLFPGFAPVNAQGNVVGLTGKKLADVFDYNSTLKSWDAPGVPVYPVVTGTAKDVMTDPLGGAKRNPFLTMNVSVKNASGTTLATTSTIMPVAFGGCCSCHLPLAGQNGYPSTPAGSFAYLGKLHSQNSSGIDISMIDPDGDGVGGPVRCSWCHWDPAMGENSAPGWPAATRLLPGATFTLKKSAYSFSDVLHRFHAQNSKVLTQFDANIASNCYDCHPGNNVNCYRGAHKGKTTLWCVDCHGNLTQRISTNQMAQPWKSTTLPSCSTASPGATPAFACHASNTVGGTVYPTSPTLFGKFINARGHKGSVTCQTCHGQPHGEAPSTLAADNVQLSTQQGKTGYSFPAGKDKTYALGVCNYCHPSKTSTWGVPPHL